MRKAMFSSRNFVSRKALRKVVAAALASVGAGQSAFGTDFVWDITPTNGTVTGGTGAWNTTNSNWTIDNGASNTPWVNANTNTATFGDVGGTVTLGGAITTNGITFNSGGYTVTSNTITLDGSNAFVTVAGPTGAATINSGLSHAAGTVITNNSSGLLTLGGAQTLTTAPTFTGSGNITASGVVGAGTFTKSGNGTLTLTNTGNLFSAPTVTGGTVVFGAAGTAGAVGTANKWVVSNATLQFNSAFGAQTAGTNDRYFSFVGGTTSTISIATGVTVSLRGDAITQTAASATLNKIGDGILSFGTGGTSNIGLINVNAGILQVTSNRIGSVGGIKIAPGAQYKVVDDVVATYNIAASGILTLNGTGIANSGAMMLQAQGTGATYTFARAVSLQTDSLISPTNGAGAPAQITLSGVISGPGNLIKGADGTLLLTNAGNTYGGANGTTAILNGTLQIGGADRVPTSTSLVLGDAASSTSGTFDLNGFSQTVAGLSSVGPGVANRIITSATGTPTLTVNLASGAQTFNGALGGSGTNNNNFAFTKAGAGTLTLAQANTITGAMTISGGTLRVVPYVSAAGFSVNGAALGVVQPSTPVSLTMPTLALGASADSINFELASASSSVPLIKVTTTDGLTLGAGPHTLNVSSSVALTAGTTIPLIGYTSATTISSGFTLGSLPPRTIGNLVYNTASIDLNVTGVDTIKWTGAIDSAWDVGSAVNTGGTNNWKEVISGNATNFVAGDSIRFDDSAAGNFNVNVTTIVQPSSVVVDNTNNAYTFSGAGSITGATTLAKSGTGTLTLLNNNSYTGTTTVFAGTLAVGNGGATGSLGTGNLVNNGAVIFNRSDDVTYAGSISGTGSFTKNNTNTVTLSGSYTPTGNTLINGGTLVLDAAANYTYSGVISGAGGLTKAGAGVVTLTAANTYTGPTTINGGTLQLGGGGTTGSVSTAVAVGSGGVLAFNRSNNVAFSLGISGAGGVTQAGTGIVTLSGTIAYSGPTTVSAGTLELANSTNLTLSSAAINGTLLFSGSGNVTTTGQTSGTGILNKTGTGTLAVTGASSFTGTVNIDGGTLLLSDPGASVAPSTGDLNAAVINVNNGGKFQFGQGGVTNENPDLPGTTIINISTGGTVEWKIDEALGPTNLLGGTLIMNGGNPGSGSAVNSYTSGTVNALNAQAVGGPVTKSTAGTVTVMGLASLGGALSIEDGTMIFATSSNLGSAAISFGTATTTGTLEYQGATATRAGAITLTGDGVVRVNNSAAILTLSGVIDGSGALTKQGPGTLTLTGANTYSGPTTVNGGTLRINNTSGAGDVNVNAGALGGTGTVGGATTINMGGAIAPGNSIGTLSIAAPLTFGTGGTGAAPTYLAELGSSTSDLIALTGSGTAGVLTLSNPDVLNLLPTTPITSQTTYTIATFASEAGVFDSVLINGQPTQNVNPSGANYALVTYNPQNIQVTVNNAVPEPASIGGLAVAAVGLLARRRRK